ncbi:NAD(P)-dependent oxidoreductase [Clostridium carnis]
MYKNASKDISNKSINYTYLALESKKLRVGIIGGGKAAFIKARNFINNECYVEVLSKEFSNELINLSNDIVLLEGEYNKKFIKDKHIIIIAIDNEILVNKIISHCKEEYKIYINSASFEDGMAIVPVQRSSKYLNLAISTSVGNPKGAMMVAKNVLKILEEYDDFIFKTGKMRKNSKNISKYKNDIINFICSEDFKFINEKGKDKLILEMFFGKEIVEKIYR